MSGALVVDAFRQYSKLKDFAEICQKHEFGSHLYVKKISGYDAPVVVVVIGESATRNNWHLYGYSRQTTPNLDSIRKELLVFRNLVASKSFTTAALKDMFFSENADGFSNSGTLPGLFRCAGYDCVFLSNQRRIGKHNLFGSTLFASCQEKKFLNETGEEHVVSTYDEVLLPEFERCVRTSNPDRPLVVFLHLMGSHALPEKRSPLDEKVFGISSRLDEYDNSIHYTDKLLGVMITSLKKLNRPAVFAYVSDHGETPRAKVWRLMTDIDLWEIPFVVWFSPNYRVAYPNTVADAENSVNKELQSNNLFGGFVTLGQIRGCPLTGSSADFTSNKFISGRRMIENGKVPYPQNGTQQPVRCM